LAGRAWDVNAFPPSNDAGVRGELIAIGGELLIHAFEVYGQARNSALKMPWKIKFRPPEESGIG
jgi:hypothetical protein